MGFRSAVSHFAGKKAHIYIMSTEDIDSKPFVLEYDIALGTDVREPHFYVINNTLYFSYFQAGKVPYKF